MYGLYPAADPFDRIVSYYYIFNNYYQGVYRHILNLLTARKIPRDNWRVLDIGCATGNFLQKLSRQNTNWELYGLDASPKMIATAKRRTPALSWQVGKAEALPFPDQYFDLITIVDALHYIQNQPQALSECSRALKPDGYFLIYTPSVNHIWSKAILMSGKWFGFATEKHIKPPRLAEINQLAKATGFNLLDKTLLTFPGMLFTKYWLLLFSKSDPSPDEQNSQTAAD